VFFEPGRNALAGRLSLTTVEICLLAKALCDLIYCTGVTTANTSTTRQFLREWGLHSGNRVNMTFLPAPANSGVRFRRVDLDGKPEVEARVETSARPIVRRRWSRAA